MQVSVVGLGFVGLTTAACLAYKGIKVIGIDIDEAKIKMISRNHLPFYEPRLKELVVQSTKKKNLVLSTEFETLSSSQVTIITVGTPNNGDKANLSYVSQAAESIGKAISEKKGFHVVALKSTVPPGTTLGVVTPILERSSRKKVSEGFGICSNPEFLREGNAVEDTFNPDKIVLGVIEQKTKRIMSSLYRHHLHQKANLVEVNPQTAELIKYANNTFLATKISFINTIANICQHIPGTDVEEVAHAIGLDRRIGSLFLKAGLGYGGSCFPKDVAAMIAIAEQHGYVPELLKNTQKINQLQFYKAIQLLKKLIPDLTGKTIAVLGLAFKPDTTDMREAVSTKIIRALKELGTIVKVYDPVAMNEAKKILSDSVVYCQNMKECLTAADACIIVTEWPEFKKLTPPIVTKCMKSTFLIDGRRVTSPNAFAGKIDGYAAIGLGDY
jgi:UDPglucose 6-dehydrogenase